MSLTTDDLQEIRLLVREEVESIVSRKLEPLEAKLEALENDIKAIYSMISDLQKNVA